ncbi:aldehyde dehydrogenase [Streptomyces chattanoogensis]|uniref:Aldehyde dehydrogenase n=1 Tax=Streptomyces chattanoogensis TaxID=66876 RepID=A0A0N1JV00_9ACTN|nr:aldehyde dehydrogenase [Streptomyces chattanoogensis]
MSYAQVAVDETKLSGHEGPEAAVGAAVRRARAAAPAWDALGHRERGARLLRWRRVMTRRLDEIVGLLEDEAGKVRADALIELAAAFEHLGWAARNAGPVLRRRSVRSGLLMLHQRSTVEYRPYGVIGVIGPWNYPVHTPLGSVSYALAAGNAVVLKPSEHTPGTGRWLADTFAEAVPDSPVFEVVTGDGAAGAALCRSGVDKVAFTGSPGTGARVLAACAPTLTPVLLELGGKDALVVAEDADVDAAVEAALWGGCSNAGQSCAGIERVYVAEAVHERFLQRIAQRARDIEGGADGDYGRMALAGQLDVVRRHIDDALARGARAVAGGPESVVPPYVTGPVVLADVPEDADAVREETFGPVLVVNRVRDAAEGVARTNASAYGLGGAVFARRGGVRLARSLHAGMVSVNDVLTFTAVGALPFGGRGRSGFGRIHGADGLREFAAPQALTRRRFAPPLAVQTFARGPRDMVRFERLVRRRGAR